MSAMPDERLQLPERLRDKATWLESRSFAVLRGDLEREAADEIDRLRASERALTEERDELRAELDAQRGQAIAANRECDVLRAQLAAREPVAAWAVIDNGKVREIHTHEAGAKLTAMRWTSNGFPMSVVSGLFYADAPLPAAAPPLEPSTPTERAIVPMPSQPELGVRAADIEKLRRGESAPAYWMPTVSRHLCSWAEIEQTPLPDTAPLKPVHHGELCTEYECNGRRAVVVQFGHGWGWQRGDSMQWCTVDSITGMPLTREQAEAAARDYVQGPMEAMKSAASGGE